ncbi:MAG: hypothetical protein Q9163_001108 [Psora crenata]
MFAELRTKYEAAGGGSDDDGMVGGEVERWLRNNIARIYLGQTWNYLPNYHHPDDIEYVKITDHSCGYDAKTVLTKDVDIHVDVFDLSNDESDLSQHLPSLADEKSDIADETKIVSPQGQALRLPNRRLHGTWDRYAKPVSHPIHAAWIYSAEKSDETPLAAMNELCIDRTGKTTLCQALSQQLSIRLGRQFPVCKLVKVDAQSVFSKWFSESGKMVTKLFASIETMLDEDEHRFVCVLIDEIESLAGTRQHSPSANEPKDALRAVNSLLIAVDRLRYRPNVVVMCTSNLMGAMVDIYTGKPKHSHEEDPAFLDRVARKHFIPLPCSAARYEILRTKYLELAKCGIITAQRSACDGGGNNDSSETLLDDNSQRFTPLDHNILPHFLELPFQKYSADECEARQLWRLAERCEGLSGRTLRDLPEDSLSLHTTPDPCPIDAALVALSAGVAEQFVTG